MNAPLHAGGERDFRRATAVDGEVLRQRFLRLVDHLCRKRGPFAVLRIAAARRRVSSRKENPHVLWVSSKLHLAGR